MKKQMNQQIRKQKYEWATTERGLDLMATFISTVGLASFAIFLLWVSSASAAMMKPTNTAAPLGCEEKLGNLFLSGSFLMPGSGEEMNLYVGKPRGELSQGSEVWGLIAKTSQRGTHCAAQCKVLRFERFKKDMMPAIMELACEGTTLRTLRMPLHIQWVRDDQGFDTRIRLGSSIYGVEETALNVEVNRYQIASARDIKMQAISAIKKTK